MVPLRISFKLFGNRGFIHTFMKILKRELHFLCSEKKRALISSFTLFSHITTSIRFCIFSKKPSRCLLNFETSIRRLKFKRTTLIVKMIFKVFLQQKIIFSFLNPSIQCIAFPNYCLL